MPADDAKSIVRRYFKAAQKRGAPIDELFAKGFTFRYEDSPLPLGDGDG